jgi:hypothetical protein
MSANIYRLAYDPNMVEVMEADLVRRVTDLATVAQIDMGIHGVFSLDDLEAMTVGDLCKKIAIGIAYVGAEDTKVTGPSLAAGTNANAARADVEFNFLIVLAVPVTRAGSDNRLDGSKMLSTIRQSLLGKTVQPPTSNTPYNPVQSGTWRYVKEQPQPSESTSDMLYYSQVWRVVLPIATKNS